MNSTLSAIIFVICVSFATYKLGKHFSGRSSKTYNNVIMKEQSFDKRFYSKPSFDFPNIQSELDMKLVDFASDSTEEQKEIRVTQYCKY